MTSITRPKITDRVTGEAYDWVITNDLPAVAAALSRPGWHFPADEWGKELSSPKDSIFYGLLLPNGTNGWGQTPIGVSCLEWTPSGRLHLSRIDTFSPARERFRGIGTALMYAVAHYTHVVAEQDHLGLWAIRSAVDFYRKLGFVEDPNRESLRPDEGIWMKLTSEGIRRLLYGGQAS